MASGVFNVAKGRNNELVRRVDGNDPANSALIVVLFKLIVADGTLEDFDDLGAIIADAGNTEADFTNYARKVLTDADVSAPTVDDTSNHQQSQIPNQTHTNAGGTLDNDLVKMLICYDSDTTSGTDSGIIPMTYHDLVHTTDGTSFTTRFLTNFHRSQ